MRVPTSAYFAKQKINLAQLNVKEAGYVFVYLSYEDLSNNYVQFDDFKVTHTKSNVVQYNEYYPFGLQTANSWTRENTTGNSFLANGGTELNATSNLYDLDYRNYDPVLGRMNGVDPMATKYASLTPYNFSFNDPVTFTDVSGADPDWLKEHRALEGWFNNTMPSTYMDPGGGGSTGGGYYGSVMGGYGGMAGSYSVPRAGWASSASSSGNGSSQSVYQFLSSAWDSPHGGHWVNGMGWLFSSQVQALTYGMAYQSRNNSWGITVYQSAGATEFAFTWAISTGSQPTKATVDYWLSKREHILSPKFFASLVLTGGEEELVNLLRKNIFLPLRVALHLPDAISFAANVNMLTGAGVDLTFGDSGGILVLTGPNAGMMKALGDSGGGIGWDISVGGTITELYFIKVMDVAPAIGDFEGMRRSFSAGWGGYGPAIWLDMSLGVTWAESFGPGRETRGYVLGLAFFIGAGDPGPSFNYNYGMTTIRK